MVGVSSNSPKSLKKVLKYKFKHDNIDLMIDINSILFDFDNTLVDTHKLILKADRYIFKSISLKYGVKISDLMSAYNIFREKYRINSPDHNRGYWLNKILNYVGLKVDDSDIQKYNDIFYDFLISKQKLVPYAKKFIIKLKEDGKKVAVVSSGDAIHGFKEKRIRSLGLDKYLDLIVVGKETYNISKDDPKLFISIAKQLNEDPNNIMMVGDDLEFDIKSAKMAGMKTVWITSNKENSDYADFTFENIKSMFNWYISMYKR